ncbi:hypothetical protein LX95_02165 [Mesonia algae]|uniref:Tissue inhibitor of metalloproteinase n=1 Tax=Mesonia algae TaxID=213248 RepID=A0A2W7II83_9FLAO|nr:hypothetical protein [Mesonia algae]PZW39027.1 hypothetical protein LX95_02165 [Mesonia algae]
MKKTVLIFFLIAFSSKSFACICTKFWNEWNKQQTLEVINYSDLIFIGELKTIADDCYEFEITDVFNGNVKKGEIVTGYYVTSCSDMPYVKGKYLIYGNYIRSDGKNILNYSQCSPSKKISDIKTKLESEYLKKEVELLNECFDKKVTTEK